MSRRTLNPRTTSLQIRLIAKSSATSFRRCGVEWTREAKIVPVAQFTAPQIDLLLNSVEFGVAQLDEHGESTAHVLDLEARPGGVEVEILDTCARAEVPEFFALAALAAWRKLTSTQRDAQIALLRAGAERVRRRRDADHDVVKELRAELRAALHQKALDDQDDDTPAQPAENDDVAAPVVEQPDPASTSVGAAALAELDDLKGEDDDVRRLENARARDAARDAVGGDEDPGMIPASPDEDDAQPEHRPARERKAAASGKARR